MNMKMNVSSLERLSLQLLWLEIIFVLKSSLDNALLYSLLDCREDKEKYFIISPPGQATIPPCQSVSVNSSGVTR